MPNPLVDVLIPSDLTDLQMQALHVWLATVSSTLERRRPFARRNQQHHDHVRDQRELLLLRLQLWAEETQHTQLKSELTALRTIIREKIHRYWHVGVTDGTQLETAYPITNGVRPFSVDLQAFEPENWEENHTSTLELSQLIDCLGTIPKYRVQIVGFQDSPDDYLLCGYMAAELANQYQAFAKILLRPNFYTARGAAEWTQNDTNRLAASLGSRAYEIQYDSNRSGNITAYHLLDGDAMREWTKHTRFHLHF